ERFAGPDGGIPEIGSKRGADCTDLASSRKTYRSQIRGVEEIVDICPELSLYSFGDRCRLDHREVERLIAGIVVLSAAGWRVGSRGGVDEGSGIEPLDRALDDGMGDAGCGISNHL